MRRLALPALCAALLAAQPAHAGSTVLPNRPGTFAPRDACLAAPGAKAFAATLRDAIARRDADALAQLAAEDILLDFGGGAGRAELRARLGGPEGAELWRALAEAVQLGCAMSEDAMVFPWIFAQDLGDVDPFDALLVIGPAVPLYRIANAQSAPLARLNWQIVIAQGEGLAPGAEQQSLRRVSVINSPLEGYVPSAALRSPLDYRLTASRADSGWKIASFVAGD